MWRCYVPLCMIILLCTSCKKDRDFAAKRWQSKHLEAKLYDIPVLLNAQLIQNINNTACVDETSIISYEAEMPYESIADYYQEEMERLGWWQTAAFKGSEVLLNFEKPNKYCSISIRPSKKISRVIIFIGQKNSE